MSSVMARQAAEDLALVTERVPCGVCGAHRHRRLFTERYRLDRREVRLGINRCERCGQVYVSPRLDRDSIRHVYESDAQRTISHHYCWSGRNSDERFGPLLDRLSQLQPEGRLLDVGCGTGSFLEAALERGRWDVQGIEPSPAATRASERLSARVSPLSLEQTQFPPHHFHVISLLGVLEHLHDPLGTLRHVNRLLHPAGVVVIYVPNFAYLRFKDAGPLAWLRCRQWSQLSPQEHLFQFTQGSLQQLLSRARLQVVRLDVGRPFLSQIRWRRWIKQSAFHATNALFRWTGCHVGGLEVIARRVDQEILNPRAA